MLVYFHQQATAVVRVEDRLVNTITTVLDVLSLSKVSSWLSEEIIFQRIGTSLTEDGRTERQTDRQRA